MRLLLLLKCTLFGSLILQAQDDIYDQPEPVKPRIVYQNPPDNRGDGSYENIDDSYNPEFDYRYRRSLRRMYDPYYVMPSSAFINMYSYPQFANFYNPYWGSGLVISVGNGWNDPWGWNNGWNTLGGGWNSWGNPYGWNSWNAWNNPWGCHTGWNSWGGGWNNGWNSWRGGWNNGWGGGWNNGNRNSVNPPERRISRAVRVMDPDRDYGNTRYRPSQNQSNTNRNPSPNTNTNTNTPVFRGSQGTSSPSPTVNPSPTRMGNMNSGSNSSGGTKNSGGSSGGGSSRSGRSGGGSRF